MDVSIIIINYNTFDLTSQCIASLIEKTTCRYEIILVDNASTDKDANLFLELFPGITLLKSTDNLGFSKGNNLGISKANGEYILMLNSDTVLVNNAVDLAVERMKRDSNIGALSCQLISPDGSLQHASNEENTVAKNFARAFRLHHIGVLAPRDINLHEEHYTDWIWGTFMMIPQKVINMFPGKKLHDDFFMYVEDRQWCFNIKKLGFKILYYPQAKVIHYVSVSSGISEERKFKDKVLPNEFEFYRMEYGKAYACIYYLTYALLQFLSFRKSRIHLARFYWNFGIQKLFARIN